MNDLDHDALTAESYAMLEQDRRAAARAPHPERTEPRVEDSMVSAEYPNKADGRKKLGASIESSTDGRAPHEPPGWDFQETIERAVYDCIAHGGFSHGQCVGFCEHCLTKLEAQASRPAPPLDWQPIATAPKDDSIVFITNGKFVSPCHFTDGAWYEMNNDPSDAWGRPVYEHEVTHWMPLPSPPAAHAAPQE